MFPGAPRALTLFLPPLLRRRHWPLTAPASRTMQHGTKNLKIKNQERGREESPRHCSKDKDKLLTMHTARSCSGLACFNNQPYCTHISPGRTQHSRTPQPAYYCCCIQPRQAHQIVLEQATTGGKNPSSFPSALCYVCTTAGTTGTHPARLTLRPTKSQPARSRLRVLEHSRELAE